MNSNWAAENLQVIRTLMERSAVYRRALAPVNTFLGILCLAAALTGWLLKISSPTSFVLYCFCIGVVASAGAFLMLRRQAWRDAEPFWSPPARRVAQAMLPPVTAGFVLGLAVLIQENLPAKPGPPLGGLSPSWEVLVGLPSIWGILYGCALHSAGFFMPRGIKLFGWLMILGCCGVIAFGNRGSENALISLGYGIIGFIGVLHLAYGIYVFFTGKRRNET
jgi:hypothetical protein